MIIKALLAWMGLQAAPPYPSISSDPHSDAVHNILNVRNAVVAGHQRMVRLQKVADRAAAHGNDQAAAAIAEQQNEIRVGLDDLARRLD